MVMASERKKRTKPSSAMTDSPRKTRSSSAKLAAQVTAPAGPAPKKRKVAKEKSKLKGLTKETDDVEPAAPSLASPDIDGAGKDLSKTIIVEACKQCNSFKTRATKVKEDLESSVLGITVTVNPVKFYPGCKARNRSKRGLQDTLQLPRKGCFEIRDANGEVFVSLLTRDANGEVFVSLLDMPRPFKKMKELDMDEVIADIVKRIE